jgi:hypothetical protein
MKPTIDRAKIAEFVSTLPLSIRAAANKAGWSLEWAVIDFLIAQGFEVKIR